MRRKTDSRVAGNADGNTCSDSDDLDLCDPVVPRPLQQCGQRADVVRAEHHVHPRCPFENGVSVLLCQTASDGDLHVGIGFLARHQVADVAVELVVRVLAHRAGVEDHDVGIGTLGGADW